MKDREVQVTTEPQKPIPQGFRLQSGDLLPSHQDRILINTERVLQRRSMRRITDSGRKGGQR